MFRDDEDYCRYLSLLKKLIKEIPVRLYAYCLMPNHYHLFLRQDADVPAYKIPERLFSCYVKRYNRRYHRHGRLMASPLQHRLVDNLPYMLELCRYIHRNAMKAGLVDSPEKWPYANYAEWLGLRHGTLFHDEILRNHFDSADEYRAFVMKKADIPDEKLRVILIDYA